MLSLVLQCANEAEDILIKEEQAEEDVWKNGPEDKLSEFKRTLHLVQTHTHMQTSSAHHMISNTVCTIAEYVTENAHCLYPYV